MKKMKENNKGFSLVELIVVIAIMAILAVTLAPRLTAYIEKARKASDKEVVNTIFTAAKLANIEEPLGADAEVSLGVEDGVYTVEGKKWKLNTAFAVDTITPEGPQEFFDAMELVLDNFELKSNSVVAATAITLTSAADGKITVTLDYAGDGYTEGTDYSISE